MDKIKEIENKKELIKDILATPLGEVEVDFDVVNKKEDVLILFVRDAGDTVVPLSAKYVKNMSNEEKVDSAYEILEKAYNLLNTPEGLKRFIDLYMEALEGGYESDFEDIIDADEEDIDLRDYPTESEPIDSPKFKYDYGSYERLISLDDIDELYGEE